MAKILLVEDDNNLREIFEMRLQAEGYQTVTAGDGEEALVIAMKEKPDLIIADIMMPRMSGFEMLETLRAAPEMAKTKVIMMTALGQAEDQVRGAKLGVVKYLVKSQVTLEDFARVVREVVAPGPGLTSLPANAGANSSTEASSANNNKVESEKSMDDPTTPPSTNPDPTMPPATDGGSGSNPISGPAPTDGQQTMNQEKDAVAGQVNDFASGTPSTTPTDPAAGSSDPAAPMGGSSDVPVTPPPADPTAGSSDPTTTPSGGSGAPL